MFENEIHGFFYRLFQLANTKILIGIIFAIKLPSKKCIGANFILNYSVRIREDMAVGEFVKFA